VSKDQSRQLSSTEAVETWILRFEGEHVTRICAKFDVNPYRLYEVWEQKKHIGSREKAQEIINRNLPDAASSIVLKIHQPKRCVSHRSPIDPHSDLFGSNF
jgi:hypothetical protein